MDVVAVLERAASVDLAVAGRAGVCSVAADLARVTAWVEARRVACIRRLHELPEVTFPEVAIADATREPMRDAEGLKRRADTLTTFSRFAKALAAGEINPAHVDAVSNGLTDVPDDKRLLFTAEQDRLLDVARSATPESFAKAVRGTVKRVLSSEDAVQRLRRQQRETRLSMWTNKATGMLHLRGRWDPETGAELLARLESARVQLFADSDHSPDTCPTDPGERDDHLRGLTLARLLLGQDAPGWRPEALVVTDERTLDDGFHGGSIIDVGADVDLPIDALRRLVTRCQIVRVVMRNGVVTSVGGRSNLNLGRTSRLANLDQRRALRAMYPTCAIPDCPVRFLHCRIHHVKWWEDGFDTDLDNLVPLCSRHHHAVHDRGWILSLDPVTRTLRVMSSDGRVTSCPAPYAHSP